MNRKRVAKWLAAAGSFAVLTSCRGEVIPYAAEKTAELSAAVPVILRDRESGRRFLMEAVSAADRGERQELTVTGKDGVFDTLAIAQMFPEVINISKLDLGTRSVNGELLTDCRIGFEWRGRAPDPEEDASRELVIGLELRKTGLGGRPEMCSCGKSREKSAGFAVWMMIIRMAAEDMGNVHCFWQNV